MRNLFSQHRKLLFTLLLTLVAASGVSLFLLFKDIPNPTKLTRIPAPVSTQIFDRKGRLLYEFFQDKNRTPIKLKDLPPYVSQASIAIEDKNFYHHHGLDLLGIARAGFKTVTGQRLEGGSTITQQLVKIALLNDPSRTIIRKLREAALALLTEAVYGKDQILELYLNHIPYGGTAYGIESAAMQYFDKHASQLSLGEAALLAALPQSPSRYSPFGAHPETAKARQQLVLNRMVEDKYITADQAQQAFAEPLKYSTSGVSIKAPHFVFWVKDQLVERYGEDQVSLGGLRVTTSLDLDLQNTFQASLSAQVNKLKKLRVGNGAAIVTQPRTGEVLAMIGSRDYFDTEHDGNVNVALAPRQPGSSIKPLNYATGLLLGYNPATMYLDIPTCFNQAGQKQYCPKNYDGSFHGPVQMRFALGNSYNIPAVKQLALNGVSTLIATASAMGITTWTDPSHYGLSLTLGGGEVKMVDMAVAFGVFANEGVRVPLHPILKVETYQGQVLDEYAPTEIADYVGTLHQDWETFWKSSRTTTVLGDSTNTPATPTGLKGFFSRQPTPIPVPPVTNPKDSIKTVLPEEVTFLISHILLDNNARMGSFGPTSQLVIPKRTISVKTGTTNDLRDNWTIGYTPDYLVAVWVGNNDNSPMSYIASGITGAAPIWHDIFSYLLRNEKDHFPTQPAGIVSAQICTLTGLLPTPDQPCETRTEYFIKQNMPTSTYPTRRQIWVKRDTKVPPLPGEQVTDLDLEEHTIASDPFTAEFCLDCAYPAETKSDPNNPNQQVPTGKINYPQFIIDLDKFYVVPPIWRPLPTPTPPLSPSPR